MRKQTLEEFFENPDNPDGYYVVWKSGFFNEDDKKLFGFSGEVVFFTDMHGFMNAPDWMNEAKENEVLVALLAVLPDESEF